MHAWDNKDDPRYARELISGLNRYSGGMEGLGPFQVLTKRRVSHLNMCYPGVHEDGLYMYM